MRCAWAGGGVGAGGLAAVGRRGFQRLRLRRLRSDDGSERRLRRRQAQPGWWRRLQSDARADDSVWEWKGLRVRQDRV